MDQYYGVGGTNGQLRRQVSSSAFWSGLTLQTIFQNETIFSRNISDCHYILIGMQKIGIEFAASYRMRARATDVRNMHFDLFGRLYRRV